MNKDSPWIADKERSNAYRSSNFINREFREKYITALLTPSN